jgi:hypothetical protein
MACPLAGAEHGPDDLGQDHRLGVVPLVAQEEPQARAAQRVRIALVVELRRFCPAAGVATFKKSRKVREDASAALKMIRKVVEANAPPGSVPNEIVDRVL